MNITALLCYESAVNKDELWGDKAPLLKALPVLVLQMALAMGSNLVFLFILRPLRQPRIVVDLLSALVISPIVLELVNSHLANDKVWPKKGKTNLHMLANMGLLYAMFIKGLQMDLTPVSHRRGIKALSFSLGVILLPFAVGSAISAVFSAYEIKHLNGGGRGIFVYWGAVLASSCFPTVATVLARLKLLCTEVGRSALCIGMINDLGSWIFIVIVIAISALPPQGDPSGWSWDPFVSVMFFALCFWGFCFAVIRPLLIRAISNNKEGENFPDSTIHVLLFMVMAAGLAAEFFGAYAFLGAFILGLSIPHGFLAQTLADKMEDCVSALLMPLYYVTIVMMMRGSTLSAGSMDVALILIAVMVKPLCVLLVSAICGVPFRDGLAISVLLNSKGLLSVVIIAVGFERGHLTREAVLVLVSIILASTVVVEPLMSIAYNRVMKNTKPYDNRTVGGLKSEDEFRVISCVHAPRSIPGVINLLEISGGSNSPMCVFALHLMELIGRTSAMLIVHESNDHDSGGGSTLFSRPRAQSDQIITAFENYERQHTGSTAVQTLTIVSPLETMHEDICHLAEDKQVSMILLPFHKQQGMDGKLEDDRNMEIRSVNQNVMAGAPCTVGLLIDRGIGMLSISNSSSSSASASASNGRSSRREGELRAALFYFGGPDDREALSYARRLSNVALTLIRFISGTNPVDVEPIIFPGDEEDEEKNGNLTVYTEHKHEKDKDDQFIASFLESANADAPVDYIQMASNSGADTVAMLREMDHRKFDLYLVGRGNGVLSPMTAGLIEWSECPELGAIGDVLVTSDFASDVSVLVVQEYPDARTSPPQDATVIHL